MLVQISIYGQYSENYGAHDWDGIDACPQYWKNKGEDEQLVVCNVSLENLPEVVKEIESRLDEYNYLDDYSSCIYYGINITPNKLSNIDMIALSYKAYDEITSISQEEVQAFLKCFGMEKEEDESMYA